ncbi:MAG: hypothetical protein Q9218_008232, partial [Villophora microphyllina]
EEKKAFIPLPVTATAEKQSPSLDGKEQSPSLHEQDQPPTYGDEYPRSLKMEQQQHTSPDAPKSNEQTPLLPLQTNGNDEEHLPRWQRTPVG